MLRLPAATAFAIALAALAAGAQDRPAPSRVGNKPPTAAPDPTDAETLKKADLSPTDGPKLVAYLKQRTPSDSDQARIGEIIARFGADDFDERAKAAEEIQAFGAAAVGPLKKEADKLPEAADPEVRYWARVALKKLEKVPHPAVTAAVVRAVVKLKPEGAAAALVGFLPLADTEAVADTIRAALVELAAADGRAEPVLLGALTDPSPVRRAAAYVALTEGGPADQLIRLKDAYPEVRAAVLREADTDAKFAGLWSLALVTREKEFVPALIEMIPQLPRGRIWQLEELLLTLAGSHPKGGRFLKSPESLAATRDAWLGWWKEKGRDLDLAKVEYKPGVKGLTDVIEVDTRSGFAQGRVVSLGPDLKEKWRIAGLNYPTDVKVAPNGNVWVVESNTSRVSEWVPGGASPVATRNVATQPISIDLLPDGGMLVVGRSQIAEWDKNGNQTWAYQRSGVVGGRRLPNGETVFVTQVLRQPKQQEPPPNCFRLDAKGKELKDDPKANPEDPRKALSFGYIYQMQSVGLVGGETVLVCERDLSAPGRYTERVAEYDLKTGKEVWKFDCPQNSAATCCQRLRNGNTLICLTNLNRLIEVDPSGEVVWEYQAKGGANVWRAYRR